MGSKKNKHKVFIKLIPEDNVGFSYEKLQDLS